MSKITLNILAKDILENNYFDTETCPITKAFARAGRPDLKDTGRSILENGNWWHTMNEDDAYAEMTYKLLAMYRTKDPERFNSQVPIPIEDFTATFEINF